MGEYNWFDPCGEIESAWDSAALAELQRTCNHQWEGGMCVVNDADADSVNAERLKNGLSALECGKCEAVYDTNKHSIYN